MCFLGVQLQRLLPCDAAFVPKKGCSVNCLSVRLQRTIGEQLWQISLPSIVLDVI